ncbi:MAG: hypothetical protein KF901_04745 [Myxococcales bacterium]|nr:hypothetical protein [Myxococcales bacterium]
MTPEDRKRFVQIVGQVLISDGVLGDAEREHLDRVMDELQMPDTERKAALSGIDMDSNVEERVAALSEEARARLLSAVEAAVKIDGETAKSETQLLETIRRLVS